MNQIYLQNFTKDELIEDIRNSILSEITVILGQSTKPSGDKLLTRKETAERLRIHISSVGRWMKSGDLIPHYVCGKVYFKENELPI